MRRVAAVVGGVAVAGAGCFAPFSWPDDRRPADPVPVAADLAPEPDALGRAADCLDRGDEAGAVPHLRAHVREHPDAVLIRVHLAELLHRAGRPADARAEFERAAADADRPAGPARDRLVHCHTRLMELARDAADDYGEHLHRGVGLVLLVNRWDADPARRDDDAAEQTLAKAVAALRTATAARPADARANLYLAEALARLGQPAAAGAAYRAAAAGLPDPAVPPAERERIAAGLAAGGGAAGR